MHLSKRLNRRWADLPFAGLFMLLRFSFLHWESFLWPSLWQYILYPCRSPSDRTERRIWPRKYECVATNSAGTRYSAPANLYVRGRNDVTVASRVHSGSGGIEISTGSVWLCQDLISWCANNDNSWSILVGRELNILNTWLKKSGPLLSKIYPEAWSL